MPITKTRVLNPPITAKAALTALVAGAVCLPLHADSQVEALQKKLQQLQQELVRTRAELEKAQNSLEKAAAGDDAAAATGSDEMRFKLAGGELKVGGAVRVNYAVGDYAGSGGATRAWEDDGNFSLDTYRINLDYLNGSVLGKLEYRWYDGYNFLHTGWLGYRFENDAELQAGVNRVPFGPGPYGVSQSWFFDQHYYVGLSDDMDLGVKYSLPLENWRLDLAYYFASEGTYTGTSKDSARYTYDVVNESGMGYEERNQLNLRGIYHLKSEALTTDLGFSLQYGELDSQGIQDDGEQFAGSLHMVNKWRNFTLASQLTYYDFDVDAAQPLGSDKLVQTGAYDFPSTLAAQAWLPAVSLSYHLATPDIGWLDYVVPYIEYSALLKEEREFNDSELAIIGAAWASGGWYIYTDFAFSNGNEFVGGDTPFGDRLGANSDDDWITRFNINLGYYF